MEGLIKLIEKNIDYYSGRVQTKIRELKCAIKPPELQKPIFIVGCSRAGTTLVYKTFSESAILGSLQKETHDFWSSMHPPSERGWDTHEIPPHLASEAEREYVSRFFFASTGKTRIVDKNNQNGLSISYLHKLFPDAYFVFIKRNPGDNINSLIYGWGKAEEFGTWSKALPERVAIENGRYIHWCFFLANGWRQYTHASIEEVCAFQYRAINEAILKSKQDIPKEQWYDLCYETLIADPVNGFREVIQGCNMTFDDHLERHCRYVIKNPYNAFSEIKIDKWKESSNRKKIERVLASVDETARKLGYLKYD